MTRTMPRDTRSSQRPDDWRQRAACLGQWAVMHPDNDEREIANARRVCAGCPVSRECFWDAVATDDMAHGIRAGLRASERRAVVKEINRRKVTGAEQPTGQEVALVKVPKASQRKSYTDIRDLFEDNTKRLIHGHLAWTGPAKPSFEGRSYNPKQVAFIVDRGRPPVGRVLATCGVAGCVLPAHVADDEERMQCGSRSGYQRHLKNGEMPCDACRQANTDADNRLRRTGTSKVAA